MAYENCINIIQQAAGRDLTNDELDAMLTALQAKEKYIKAKGIVTDDREAALQAASELANNIEMAAVIEQRNHALNMVKRIEKVSFVLQNFGSNYAEGLEALLVGVNRAKTGARNGVAQLQKGLRDKYMAGFEADLLATGHINLFTTGTMDRDVTRALWSMGKDGEATAMGKLPREAVEIAEVIHKWQEIARTDANDSGAWIREAKGYIVKQAHDASRIKAAGQQQWMADAQRFFDLGRMGSEAGDGNVNPLLAKLYTDLASGMHLKPIPDDEMAGFKGPSNLARKVSQSREIYFKDADAWFEYNQLYGNKNLREAFISGLTQRADQVGLLKGLGTNPTAMLDTIRNDLLQVASVGGDVENLTRMNDSKNTIDMYLKAVDGSMNVPGNALWAKRSATLRSVETLAKLGGMIFSQLNDIAVFASEMRYQGRGFLSGMGEAVAGLGKNLKDEERRELLLSLDVAMESMIGGLGHADSLQDPGAASKAMQLFMKLNLSQWWTEHMKASAALGMSHHMAINAAKTFADLSPEYQRVLSLYGIGDQEWALVGQAAQKHLDGRAYVTPELIREVTGDEALKRNVEEKLRTYFTDRKTFAALEPDAKTKAMMLQGTQAGTVPGELMRFMMQFKSFTGAYMQKIMGRELYGRGYEGDAGFSGIYKALANGNGEMQGLVNVIVWSSIAGYGSMVIKDAIKGRAPRDPLKAETWAAAALQGGGMGIYGDFLFGQANRFGGKFSDNLVGPVPAMLGEIVDIYHKALRGDDVAAESLRMILNHTPFINLFYTRIALDYMIIYRMQEALNPGYLRRMERRVEKENGQTFLFRPSEIVR